MARSIKNISSHNTWIRSHKTSETLKPIDWQAYYNHYEQRIFINLSFL